MQINCLSFSLQMRKSKTFLASEVLSLTVQNVDYKFILIPVAFILLRIWSAIVVFLLVYVGIKHEEVPNTVAIILINLSVRLKLSSFLFGSIAISCRY